MDVIEIHEDPEYWDEHAAAPQAGDRWSSQQKSETYCQIKELLTQDLASIRRTLIVQHEQALFRMESSCLESVTKMEAINDRLRGEKRQLEQELRSAQFLEEAPGRMSRDQRTVMTVMTEDQRTVMTVMSKSSPPPPEFPDTSPIMDLSISDSPGSPGATSSNSARAKHPLHTLTQRSTFYSERQLQLERAKANNARNERAMHVFPDASDMKKKVKEAVMKPEYNVFDYYNEEGIFQQIARSTTFDVFTVVMVIVNAIWIWIDIDLNRSEVLIQAHPVFIVVENVFCTYFTGELVVRFLAFKHKTSCIRDWWFNYDLLLVLLMVTETWVMSIVIGVMGTSGMVLHAGGFSTARLVKLMRLTRMARMVRLLRAVPELMVLCKSVAVAMRSVLFTLCLLVIIIYVFALLFVQLQQAKLLGGPDSDQLMFVSDAMIYLLVNGILPDLEPYIQEFRARSWLASVIFFAFILVASLTVMNMLLGVLVQIIGTVSDVERERMTVQWVKVKLLEMMESTGLDDDGNMQISRSEFERLLLNPKAAKMVQEVGVDVVSLVDFSDFIFENDRELTFPEFMELVLQLRGSNIATVKDIVDLRKFVSSELQAAVKTVSSSVRKEMVHEMKKDRVALSRAFTPVVPAERLIGVEV